MVNGRPEDKFDYCNTSALNKYEIKYMYIIPSHVYIYKTLKGPVEVGEHLYNPSESLSNFFTRGLILLNIGPDTV